MLDLGNRRLHGLPVLGLRTTAGVEVDARIRRAARFVLRFQTQFELGLRYGKPLLEIDRLRFGRRLAACELVRAVARLLVGACSRVGLLPRHVGLLSRRFVGLRPR